MTVLSDKEILEHLNRRAIWITPFEASRLTPAGYDLRSSLEVVIEPKQYKLTATLETIEMGLNIMASLHIRSYLAREGIIGSFAVVDPGFRGQLTLNLHNAGTKKITIRKEGPIVQIVFHKLGSPTRKGYAGSYQNSKGIILSKRNKL